MQNGDNIFFLCLVVFYYFFLTRLIRFLDRAFPEHPNIRTAAINLYVAIVVCELLRLLRLLLQREEDLELW